MQSTKYLIVISTGYDDIPVRLFDGRKAAVDFAKACDPEKELARCQKFLERDLPHPCAVRMSRIRNGKVVSDEVLRELHND